MHMYNIIITYWILFKITNLYELAQKVEMELGKDT